MKLSIIIPTLNESGHIKAVLAHSISLQIHSHEIIVADGGSEDNTVEIAGAFANKVVSAKAGRARQMNAGADAATGDVLLFLHADSLLPRRADKLIQRAIENNKQWGRFDLKLSGSHWLFSVIAWFINVRSRITGIATGDQGIFVARELFDSVGGYPNIHLMEDIALSVTLRKYQRPACISDKIITSSRRWEEYGILKTVFLMWRLRFAYFLGADPNALSKKYYSH